MTQAKVNVALLIVTLVLIVIAVFVYRDRKAETEAWGDQLEIRIEAELLCRHGLTRSGLEISEEAEASCLSYARRVSDNYRSEAWGCVERWSWANDELAACFRREGVPLP